MLTRWCCCAWTSLNAPPFRNIHAVMTSSLFRFHRIPIRHTSDSFISSDVNSLAFLPFWWRYVMRNKYKFSVTNTHTHTQDVIRSYRSENKEKKMCKYNIENSALGCCLSAASKFFFSFVSRKSLLRRNITFWGLLFGDVFVYVLCMMTQYRN